MLSLFFRACNSPVTLICGVVYGAHNRRTVHPFSHFLLRAKLKVFSMFLLKCLLLCIFQFDSTCQTCFTNNVLRRLTSSFLNYFFINLKDALDTLLYKHINFCYIGCNKRGCFGGYPVVVSFIFLHISSQVTTSSACGSSWWYSVNSGLSAADFSQLFNPLFTSSGNSQKSNNLNSTKS